MRTAAVFVVALLLAAVRGGFASPTGFVYVLDPATGCQACAGPQVLVFDGGTAQLVTRIPLAKGLTPAGIAVSADGAHIYVSDFLPGASSIVVIDGHHHTILATYPTGHVAGRIAVRNDDSAVYIRSQTQLWRFDTATHAVTGSTTVGNGGGVAFNRATDQVVVPVFNTDGTGLMTFHDPVSLAEVQRVTLLSGAAAVSVSRTGAEILVVRGGFGLGQPLLTRVNATTRAVIDERPYSSTGSAVDPADAPSLSKAFLAGRAVFDMDTSSGVVTTIPLPVTTSSTGLAVPPGQKYLFATTARLDATGLTAVVAIDSATRQIVSTYPLDNPPGYSLMTSTPDGVASCNYRLTSSAASFTEAGQLPGGGTSAAVALITDCAWQASTLDPWVHLLSTGDRTFNVTVDCNSTGATRQSRAVIGGQVFTVTQAGTASTPPFGLVDTPQDFASNVNGSLPVTGWALDDVGVVAVHLYRDPVAGEPPTLIPLGDATLVDGARPDVQAFYSTLPFASRAGWGYMLLTNMLPGGGNGTYRLHVYAQDVEGHLTLLGTRTLAASNSTAALPFGAIDTPGQGDTVSGTIINWGWALAPNGTIPVDGSTIEVVIDGVVAGHPTYGLNRPDIAALFPRYANTNSAVGYFTFDTTLLTNGVHTIAWVVRDSLGRAQGIGSRYFTVQNP